MNNTTHKTPIPQNNQDDVDKEQIKLEVTELLNRYLELEDKDNHDYWLFESIF